LCGWGGEDAEAEVSADAVLDVDDVVPGFEVGEIDFESGPCGDGVGRLEAARTLDLIAAEDLGVGDDGEPCLREEEPAGQGAEVQRGLGSWRRLGWEIETIVVPDLEEPLTFAVVVADDVDGVVLAEPSVQLVKEIAALDFGDLWIGHVIGDGPKGVQAGE
jgi:hypothetical protein